MNVVKKNQRPNPIPSPTIRCWMDVHFIVGFETHRHPILIRVTRFFFSAIFNQTPRRDAYITSIPFQLDRVVKENAARKSPFLRPKGGFL